MNNKAILLSAIGIILVGTVFVFRNNLGNAIFYGTESYINPWTNIFFLPLVLAILFVFLFYTLLQKLSFEEKDWILAVFAISPAFAGLFSSVNNQSSLAFLSLATILIYIQYKNYFLLIPTSILSIYILVKWQYSLNFSFYSLISELGSFYGVSFFTVILAMYGVVLYFKNNKNSKVLIFLICSLIIIFTIEGLNIFFHLMISFFAGRSLHKLFNKKWELPELKIGFFILILTALSFSSLSHVIYLSYLPPLESFQTHLQYKLSKDDVVLTTKEMAAWIEYFTKAKTVTNENIFNTYNFDETKKFLKKNNITQIVVPSYEFEGRLNKDEGLFFLLRNENVFEKQLSHKDINIWKIK
ncbi:hypothetical protein HY837_01350 [archaeon]|nr:hypothetical protein [archaeon]